MHFRQPFSLVLAVISSACLASPTRRNENTLEWKGYPGLENKPGIALANLAVPMDWDNPTKVGNVTLGITKLSARDPSVRKGYEESVDEADTLCSAA